MAGIVEARRAKLRDRRCSFSSEATCVDWILCRLKHKKLLEVLFQKDRETRQSSERHLRTHTGIVMKELHKVLNIE
jgi:hypothetical protein